MAESQLISVEVFLQFRCGWNFCCWCPVLIFLGICCHCDCRYVGRTTQRLQDRINQHIPKSIRTGHQQQKFQPQRNCKKTLTEINCDSAIGQHLLQNKACANNFNTNQFSILAKARTQFHLSTLEATLIRILKPELCRQKEFVYYLQLIH